MVEFDNDNKFEVIDKTDNQELDLNSFKEGIRFPYEKIRTNQLIVFYKPKLAPKRCVLLKEKGCRIIFLAETKWFTCLRSFKKMAAISLKTTTP